MSNITVSKQTFKKLTKNGQKAKKFTTMRKQKLALHKQNNIYGQYLIQESKDIDRTLKGLEKILIQ